MSRAIHRSLAIGQTTVSALAIWQHQYGDLLLGLYWLLWFATS